MQPLFDAGPSKRRKAPKSVRAQKGHEALYRITYGTMHAYARALDPDGALQQWAHRHKIMDHLIAEAVVRPVTQDELDLMATQDPKLLARLRNL